ncbi:MAG: hypothetical protein KIC80_00810 [Brachyspira sp.]|nr:hypothetical protein [Brachyspira sp.]
MINIDKNNKLAFSLFETLVVMGIVAIFVTACANVFTKKRNRVTEKTPHGRFECYYSGGSLKQQYFVENIPRSLDTVSKCKFKPIKNAPYYVINLVGGGGAGSASSSGHGGGAGEYKSFFVTSIEKELEVIPGRGAAVGGSATESIVNSIESTGTKTIASVRGGTYGFDKSTMDGSNVSDCSIIDAKYACARQPVCNAYTEYVQISYCKEDDMAGTNDDAYVTEQLKYIDINSQTVLNGSMVTYEEPDDKTFKFALTIQSNMTDGADVSQFNTYLKAIGIENGIITAAPGNGGAKGQPGNDGGAVIIW